MAKRVRANVEGGTELLQKMHRMGLDVGAILEQAAMAGAELIANAANQIAPEAKIGTEVAWNERGQAAVNIGPPAEKWYWRFLEFGATAHEITGNPLIFQGDSGLVIIGRVEHTGIAATPFLRPAFDDRKDAAVDATGGEIRKAIEE